MRLAISEVAMRVGLKPSAIRYYERIGILPAAERAGGKRRYDEGILIKLAVIQRARRVGFTLDEIRQLFFGFKEGTPASMRWRKLSKKKITEIDDLMTEIKALKRLLEKMIQCCRCVTLEQCGRGILNSDSGRPLTSHIIRLSKN